MGKKKKFALKGEAMPICVNQRETCRTYIGILPERGFIPGEIKKLKKDENIKIQHINLCCFFIIKKFYF